MLWKKLLVDKAKDEESQTPPTNYNQNEPHDLYALENEYKQEMEQQQNNEESANGSIREQSLFYDEERPPSTVKSSLERAEGQWKGKNDKRMAKSHTEALILCDHNEQSVTMEQIKSMIQNQYQKNCRIVIDRTIGVDNNLQGILKFDWNVLEKKMVKDHFQALCTKIATSMSDDRSTTKEKNAIEENQGRIVEGCEQNQNIQETLSSSQIIRKEDNQIIIQLVKQQFSKRAKSIIQNMCPQNSPRSLIANNMNQQSSSSLLIKEEVQKAFKKSCQSILNQLHFDTQSKERTKVNQKMGQNRTSQGQANYAFDQQEQSKVNKSEESILNSVEMEKEQLNRSLEKQKEKIQKSKHNEILSHNGQTGFHELGFEMPVDDFIKQIEQAGIDVADLASNQMSRNEKSRENEDFHMKQFGQLKINRYSSDNYEFVEVINAQLKNVNTQNHQKHQQNPKKYQMSLNLSDIRVKMQEIVTATQTNLKNIQNYVIDSQRQFSNLFHKTVDQKQKQIDYLKRTVLLKQSIIKQQQQKIERAQKQYQTVLSDKQELIQNIFEINQKLVQSDLRVQAEIQQFISNHQSSHIHNNNSQQQIKRLTSEIEELTKICQNSQILQKKNKQSEKLSLSIELERISRREALLQQKQLEIQQNIHLLEQEKLQQSMYIAQLNQRDRQIHETQMKLKQKLIKIQELQAELSQGFANVQQLKIQQEIKNQKLLQEEQTILNEKRKLDQGIRNFISRERAATQYESELLRHEQLQKAEYSNGRSREYLHANNFDAGYQGDYQKVYNGTHNRIKAYNQMSKLLQSPNDHYSKLQFNQRNAHVIKTAISPQRSHIVVKSSHSPNGRLPSELNKKDKFMNLANKSSQNMLSYPRFRESMPSKLKSPYFNATQKKVADHKINDLGSRIDNLRNEIRMEINATTKAQ